MGNQAVSSGANLRVRKALTDALRAFRQQPIALFSALVALPAVWMLPTVALVLWADSLPAPNNAGLPVSTTELATTLIPTAVQIAWDSIPYCGALVIAVASVDGRQASFRAFPSALRFLPRLLLGTVVTISPLLVLVLAFGLTAESFVLVPLALLVAIALPLLYVRLSLYGVILVSSDASALDALATAWTCSAGHFWRLAGLFGLPVAMFFLQPDSVWLRALIAGMLVAFNALVSASAASQLVDRRPPRLAMPESDVSGWTRSS